MTQRTVRKMLWTLLTAAAGLGMVGSAQAALVTGRFDPEFGAALSGVGFKGTATFSISQNCLDLVGSGFMTASYKCGGADSGMSFQGAHVDFYSSTSPSTIVGTLDFLADPSGGSSILGMFIDNGQVIGVQSKIIGPISSTLTGNPAFNLVFGLLSPPTNEGTEAGFGSDGDSDLDDLTASDTQATSLILSGVSCPSGVSCVSAPASTTYDVPEPGSLALVLGALAAAGTVRRRRNR